MTELDKKTQSLNQSGSFLQFHVLNELTKRKWSSLVETPVTVAPFINHPAKHPFLYRPLLSLGKIPSVHFSQAVAESQTQFLKEETSVDIYASKIVKTEYDGNVEFRLCIEVKKNDPRYSDWCFFRQKTVPSSMVLISESKRKGALVSLFIVPPTDNNPSEIHLEKKQFHFWDEFKHEVADYAIALQNEEVKREYYKSEKTKVDDAARQIIQGTYGLTLDSIHNQVLTGSGYPDPLIIYVPVIVTNANLYLCDFKSKDIDSTSGQITTDPDYKKIDSIIYEYPNPKTVQYPDPLSATLSPQQRGYVSKWHLLIVSPAGLITLLEKLDAEHLTL